MHGVRYRGDYFVKFLDDGDALFIQKFQRKLMMVTHEIDVTEKNVFFFELWGRGRCELIEKVL